MTTPRGLVDICFHLAVIVASSSLSSKRVVLIHQFDDGTELAKLPAADVAFGIALQQSGIGDTGVSKLVKMPHLTALN
jgi:hypothetical protein